MLRTYVSALLLSLSASAASAGIYSGPSQTSHPIDAAIPSNSDANFLIMSPGT